jgi:hypothetical protein
VRESWGIGQEGIGCSGRRGLLSRGAIATSGRCANREASDKKALAALAGAGFCRGALSRLLDGLHELLRSTRDAPAATSGWVPNYFKEIIGITFTHQHGDDDHKFLCATMLY